jgi:hypothetical protein
MAALRITGRAVGQLWPLNSNFYIAYPKQNGEQFPGAALNACPASQGSAAKGKEETRRSQTRLQPQLDPVKKVQERAPSFPSRRAAS